MLQRIQTLYLLGVILCIALVFIFPVLQTTSAIYLRPDSYPIIFVLTIIILLIALISVFLYKKRPLQIKLCWLNNLLIFLFYALFVYGIFSSGQVFTFENLQLGMVFPLIALIFNLLAIRFIRKDEKLIKSLSRLR